MSQDNGGPAFPLFIENGATHHANEGMTLLDYFAAQALKGFMGRSWDAQLKRDGDEAVMQVWVESAYSVAALMLAERARRMK